MEQVLQLAIVVFAALATGALMVNWVGLSRAMSRLSVSTYVEFHQERLQLNQAPTCSICHSFGPADDIHLAKMPFTCDFTVPSLIKRADPISVGLRRRSAMATKFCFVRWL